MDPNLFRVVAVAGSAGSITPLCHLLEVLPATFGAAMLIAHHRSAAEGGHLVDVFRRCAPLPVRFAVDGENLAPRAVLLAPPHSDLLVIPGERVAVPLRPPQHFVQPSADLLFSSLAAVVGPRAVAIVLSGAGVDGAVGAGEVKAAGGLVVAQTEISAEIPGMPSAAIRSGAVDLVLPPAQIAGLLLNVANA
ncbi:MAG: chemotaxis protein CheB [Candidatus Dormibacteraeota bacterium]|nr:chemotaxis protein CheB [Candidatus Dormibacteraeota bacterium]